MAHKDFGIRFAIEGRRYEAVGFLNEYEPTIPGHEMLKRTDGENCGANNFQDLAFIRERFSRLPAVLNQFLLIINNSAMYSGRSTRCFVWQGDRWGIIVVDIDDISYGAGYLVLRRLS